MITQFLLETEQSKTIKVQDTLLTIIMKLNLDISGLKGSLRDVGNLFIPVTGCTGAALRLLDMECDPAKRLRHLAGRGRTGGRRSPGGRTAWPVRCSALTAGKWTERQDYTFNVVPAHFYRLSEDTVHISYVHVFLRIIGRH